MSEVQNKIVRNPSIDDVTKNIREVISLIKLGYSSLPAVRKGLEKRGLNWSDGKVERYYKGALDIMTQESQVQQLGDPRLLLVSQAEEVATSEWEAILDLKQIRNEAFRKLEDKNCPMTIEQLTIREQQAVLLEPKDLANIESKAKMVILKAQERVSELYGFKQDKTILVQHKKDEQLKYIDKINDEWRDEYRDKMLPANSSKEEEEESIIENKVGEIISAEKDDEFERL